MNRLVRLANTEPSWLNMTEHGATTVWDDWDGLLPDAQLGT